MLIVAAQYVGHHKDEDTAIAEFNQLKKRARFAGGRVLPPIGMLGRTSWRVQAFFDLQTVEEIQANKIQLMPMVEDCSWVAIPEGLLETFGIRKTESMVI